MSRRKNTDGGQRLDKLGVKEEHYNSNAIDKRKAFDDLSSEETCALIEILIDNDEESEIGGDANKAFIKLRSLAESPKGRDVLELARNNTELVKAIGIDTFEDKYEKVSASITNGDSVEQTIEALSDRDDYIDDYGDEEDNGGYSVDDEDLGGPNPDQDDDVLPYDQCDIAGDMSESGVS